MGAGNEIEKLKRNGRWKYITRCITRLVGGTMGAETELLEWKRLKASQMFYNCGEGRQYTQEKKARLENEEALKEHENYMLMKGFEFNETSVTLPNGEIYEF